MTIDPTVLGELANQMRKAAAGQQQPAPARDDVQAFEQVLAGAEIRPEMQAIQRAVKAETSLNLSVDGIDPGHVGPETALAVVQRSNEIHFFSEFWAKLAAGFTQGINKLVSMS